MKEFDLISAIWIMACNDEGSILTYQGINHRLQLNDKAKVQKLIESRPDLFRLGVTQRWLDEWKEEMKKGKSRPSWIRDPEDISESERLTRIEGIIVKDVFRSQFRTKKDSPQSELDVVEWGLKHIDRLRKAEIEKEDTRTRSWQVWLIFCVGFVNLVATVVVAITKK